MSARGTIVPFERWRYATNTAGEILPTKQGVSIRPTLLRPVIDALLQAEGLLVADGTA